MYTFRVIVRFRFNQELKVIFLVFGTIPVPDTPFNQWRRKMEKVCGLVVFLAVYQLAGMLHYHDWPVLKSYQVSSACNAVTTTIGWGRLC